MDDKFCGKKPSAGDLDFASLASTQFPAFIRKSDPGSSVDSPVNAAPSKKGLVCRIHNSIHLHLRNIADFKINMVVRLIRFQDQIDQLLSQQKIVLPGIDDDPCLIHVPAGYHPG